MDEHAEPSEELRESLRNAIEEIDSLKHRLRDQPARVEALEEELLEARGQLTQARAGNEKLSSAMQQTRDQLAVLREEVQRLTQPPAVYGTFANFNEDGTVDIIATGRKMRVSILPALDPGQLHRGDEVVLNESFTVIGIRDFDGQGEVVTVKEVIDDFDQAAGIGRLMDQ